MRQRYNTPEEAKLGFDELSDEEKALYPQVAEYCDECVQNKVELSRLSVQKKFKRSTDLICRLMRIWEGFKGANAEAVSAEPALPPELAAVTAEQRASTDRAEQTLNQAFREALVEERHRVQRSYQAEIDGGKAAIRALSARLTDFESMTDMLSEELSELRKLKDEQDKVVEKLSDERDAARSALASVSDDARRLQDEVAALSQNAADLRQSNGYLSQHNQHTTQELDTQRSINDALMAELADAKAKVAVLTRSESHLFSVISDYRGRLQKAHDDHAAELAAVRSDHARAIDAASEWVANIHSYLHETNGRPRA
ncbi:hypothetical protein [Bradyrhizobium sp. CCBAU 21360]|uniref:hypothetical protein n=1 Tax=Bradyrhizobium sp. CCBAU 21360 TaxID=1325081 RepID=UPI002305C82E|nr:hypothetical protein [Bradyrhizobium sp. CCBAU 21360]MDA9452325.1 hypothetical protein [Bradyrhizobium sp. CCBAU 21360]